jgi:hypothetical protein
MKKLLILIAVFAIATSICEGMILRIVDNGDGTVGILNSAYSGWSDDMYFMLISDSWPYPNGGYMTSCAPSGTEIHDDAYTLGLPTPPLTNGIWGYIGDTFGTPKPPCVFVNGITAPIGTTVKLWRIEADWTLGPLLDTCTLGSAPTDCLNSTAEEYPDWFFLSKPDCWCYARQCRGNINGKKTGPYWVKLLHLQALSIAFNKTDAQLAAIPNGICADVNHKKTGPYRVQLLDLQEFSKYFNKVEAQVPMCDQEPITTGPYNFWTVGPP